MQILILMSHILNVIAGGKRHEPFSARCHRENLKLPKKIINTIFFLESDHCRIAYRNNVKLMKQLLRDKNEI